MPEEAIALICQEEDLERLTRCLVRIGLDRVETYCTIHEFEAFANSEDRSLKATDEITASELNDHLAADQGEGGGPGHQDCQRHGHDHP